jgi:hypothetical protein
MRRWLSNIFYSFPVQLLALHVRSNLLLMVMWIVLALMAGGALAGRLGVRYLFLDPEYLGVVGFWSFFLLGMAYGGFFMSWNLTVYLVSAHHFPFLASLKRPFAKFTLNNFLVPLGFTLLYLGYIIYFQSYYEGNSAGEVARNCLGFIFGAFCLVQFYAFYFHFTNRDISYYENRGERPPQPASNIAPGRRDVDLDYIKMDRNRWKVRTYLNESFQPRLVRSVAHYEAHLLMNIFKQNHFNAFVIQLASMATLLALGYLIDFPVFRIPAAASVLILLSLITAVVGAVTYWFNEWRLAIIVLILFALNHLTAFEWLQHKNRAYGLNYQEAPATYSNEKLQEVCLSERADKDKAGTIRILENWKRKVVQDNSVKPKAVVICVSGGGLKSARWAMHVVQQADSLLGGQLLDHTVLITGASGGMIGMSYLRELHLRRQLGEPIDLYDRRYVDAVSQDMLNSIAFTIVSNDLFFPLSQFEAGGYSYYKDRGYIYEKQLNENTQYILDKTIGDYRKPEQEGIIPMLYFTPSIVNDARRLVISPQGVSFMMTPPLGTKRPNALEIDAVDFGWLFEEHDAYNLRFLSALRMNSTYPYILPNVHLPTSPEIEVMDAGFIDNYGVLSATRFLQVFREWMQENTSGVILLQIASSQKTEHISHSDNQGSIESLFNPLGIAAKVLARQEFEHDNSLGFMYDLLGKDRFEVVRFIYRPAPGTKREASISFHITAREKEDIINAIHLEENQSGLRQLMAAFPPSAGKVRAAVLEQ